MHWQIKKRQMYNTKGVPTSNNCAAVIFPYDEMSEYIELIEGMVGGIFYN